MIHRFVFHNDRLVQAEQARLSPGQSGLLCGWGLFTTMRVTAGVPFAFERHWKRLSRDAQRTHCPLPFDAANVLSKLEEVLRANEVREGCARIYIVYNQPGYWHSAEPLAQADLVICSADVPPQRTEVRLALREHGRHAASPLAGVKVISWLNNVWNLHEARQAGWDEVVLLNERGEVSECTAANIFCVRNGRAATPPLSSGCLAGVTRGILLEIGARAGIPVEERVLFPDDLYAADEVCITSTNRAVVAASEIQGRKIAAVRGPVTDKLDRAFAAYMREYVGAHAAVSRKG